MKKRNLFQRRFFATVAYLKDYQLSLFSIFIFGVFLSSCSIRSQEVTPMMSTPIESTFDQYEVIIDTAKHQTVFDWIPSHRCTFGYRCSKYWHRRRAALAYLRVWWRYLGAEIWYASTSRSAVRWHRKYRWTWSVRKEKVMFLFVTYLLLNHIGGHC